MTTNQDQPRQSISSQHDENNEDSSGTCLENINNKKSDENERKHIEEKMHDMGLDRY